jgi:hypothetical protein
MGRQANLKKQQRAERLARFARLEAVVPKPWTPFEPTGLVKDGMVSFQNSRYQVAVRNTEEGLTILSIRNLDGSVRRDWRDFQRIKNELAESGSDRYGLEVLPPESELIDTSNQYWIWVLPLGADIPFGFKEGRKVIEDVTPLADLGVVQRPWDDDNRPDDLQEVPEEAREKILSMRKRTSGGALGVMAALAGAAFIAPSRPRPEGEPE